MCDRQMSQRWDNQPCIAVIVFPQTNTPTLIQSRSISSPSDCSSPLILFFLVYMCSLFFLVPLFSCRYVVKGQRLRARCLLGQLPQDLHADPYLQMWPFSTGPVTNVSKSYPVRLNLLSSLQSSQSLQTALPHFSSLGRCFGRSFYVSLYKIAIICTDKVKTTQASHLF